MRLWTSYGEVVAFGAGPFRFVTLFGPDANKYILADHPENFLWGEALKALIPVDGATALVVSDGADHKRRRRLVQPAFGLGAIKSYRDVMVAEIDRALDSWTPGRQLDAFAELRTVIRRVAVRSLFGDSLGARADEFGAALADAIAFINRPLTTQLKVDLPGTPWRRAKRGRERADDIINAEISRRRALIAHGGSAGDDVLGHLLTATTSAHGAGDAEDGAALDDVEIRDQVVSLIAAGYDTTSATAAWTIHELLVDPSRWERAAAEARATDGYDDLKHLDAVINETLRLWPPGVVSARQAIDAFEFGGHTVPAGALVLYSPYVTQRMPDLWPHPERFDPDRWAREPLSYSFVPFGGGYRRCIGFAFALQELKVLLAEMLRRVELRRVAGPVRPTGTAALHPKDGVPVTVLAQN
jgi:cytochrome P450